MWSISPSTAMRTASWFNATVAIEDRTFREHHGVNWRRTLYGVILMFTGQDIQGGSTITQQLIKNFTGYDDVTVKRKIQEIFTALDFEKNYSKEQILEWYLNPWPSAPASSPSPTTPPSTAPTPTCA